MSSSEDIVVSYQCSSTSLIPNRSSSEEKCYLQHKIEIMLLRQLWFIAPAKETLQPQLQHPQQFSCSYWLCLESHKLKMKTFPLKLLLCKSRTYSNFLLHFQVPQSSAGLLLQRCQDRSQDSTPMRSSLHWSPPQLHTNSASVKMIGKCWCRAVCYCG